MTFTSFSLLLFIFIGATIFENKYIGSGICLTMICKDSCVIHNTTGVCPTTKSPVTLTTKPPVTTTKPPGKNCEEWGVTVSITQWHTYCK